MPWLTEPSMRDAVAFLREHLAALSVSRRTVLVVGRCSVDYRGRAESRLDSGDRVVVIKNDGTLLVHNPAGLKPVNWQPPGCRFSVTLTEPTLELTADRRKPMESVRIHFERIELVGWAQLADGAPLDLRGTEFDIRDALRDHPGLVDPGFVPWAREKMTERGPMDLYGEDAQGRRVVVEVKRTPAGIAEATQLWRYVEKERAKRGAKVRGILVAPAVSERARGLLAEHGLEFRIVGIPTLRRQSVEVGLDRQRSLSTFGGESSSPTSRQAPRRTGRH